MASLNLGESCLAEGTTYPQIPGAFEPEFSFSVNEGKSYFARCIKIYGPNPNTSTSVLAMIRDDKKIYSPEYFFHNILEINLWKGEEIKERFFTLYSDRKKKKVKIYKSVEAQLFESKPLAVFTEEGSDKLPVTCIKEGSIYEKFIYSISGGDLLETSKLIKSDKESILTAYPYLKNTLTNLNLVADKKEILSWLLENKLKETFGDLEASDFKELSEYFKKLSILKKESEPEKYGKGILAIITKHFSYVPRS